jgi:hypothetical protein
VQDTAVDTAVTQHLILIHEKLGILRPRVPALALEQAAHLGLHGPESARAPAGSVVTLGVAILVRRWFGGTRFSLRKRQVQVKQEGGGSMVARLGHNDTALESTGWLATEVDMRLPVIVGHIVV